MIPEPRLNNLYQDVILDHNKNPRNFKEISHPTQYSHGVNPLCGDDYHLYLTTKKDQIEDVGFKGQGCAISKASASLLTSLIKGKSVGEVKALNQHFLDFMIAPEIDPKLRDEIGRLKLFEGVREFPIRVKCATLIWHALQDALNDIHSSTSEKE